MATVTKAYKKFALLTLRDPTGYASHSGRIGSYSTATEGDECDDGTTQEQLGWAKNSRVPREVYKRRSQREARASGLALAKRLKVAAEPSQRSRSPVARASRVPKRQPLFTTTAGPTPAPARAKPGAVTGAEHDRPGRACQVPSRPEPTSVCMCCNGRFHTEPCEKHEGRDKKFCAVCWSSRRQRCKLLLRASDAQLARWAKLCSFPLLVRDVAGQAVCAGFQLGICRDEQCPEAHVCHGCGRSHANGAICLGARRTLSKWRAQLGKQ